MKNTKLFLAVFSAFAIFAGSTSQVLADTTITQETTCTTAYGQETSCSTVTSTEEDSKVVYIKESKLADTALDTKSTLVMLSLFSVGLIALVAKRKLV